MEDSEALATAAAEVAKRDKEKIVAAKRSLKQIVTEKVALLKKAEGELKQKLTAIELREDDESKELRYYSLPSLCLPGSTIPNWFCLIIFILDLI